MVWLDVITDKLPGPMRLRVRGRSMLPTLRPGDEVVVHPVTVEALTSGDWVVVRGAQGAFLHRYLGQRHGRVLTKGDGHMGLDPAWPPEAVLGRVVEAQRDGRCFYRRAAGQLRRERLLTAGHHVLGEVWGVLRRVKALLLASLALALSASLVWAAVEITNVTAEAGINSITVKWETASETSNLGFYVRRSLSAVGEYVRISGFIPSLDEGAGALYTYVDSDVTPGVTYYYKVEDVPASGGLGELTAPVSATVLLNATPSLTPSPTRTLTPAPTSTTPTITPTATLTPTATATAEPLPTATLNPNVRFWADKTDLAAGECTILRWETNNITAIFFDGVGVLGDGERQFCPCATESHTLRVRYSGGATEDFMITLNVTGQCTTTVAPTTLTSTPRATTPAPTLTLPAMSAPGAAATQVAATATATQMAPPPAESTASPFSTDAPLANPLSSPVTPMPSLVFTRGPVSGESVGVPVEDILSVWLLIVGGIVGAGFIGAGIFMWKRQQ